MSKSKVDPCGVCSLRVKVNSVLCLQRDKLIHSSVNMVIPNLSINLTCRKCDGNIGEAVEQEEKLCDDVKTVSEFTYLGDMVSAGGGCEVAVTARKNCGWITFRECGELLYGNRFPLLLNGAVYDSYRWPAIL